MYESNPVPGPEPERLQPPNSVRNAVKLMYAGAVLEVIALVHVHIIENDRAVPLVIGAVIAIVRAAPTSIIGVVIRLVRLATIVLLFRGEPGRGR